MKEEREVEGWKVKNVILLKIMDKFDFDLRSKEDSIIFKLRDLLEDFEIIAGSTEIMVLISRPLANETIIQNLQAAVAASLFRFQSIDYVKKQYIKNAPQRKTKNKRVDIEYIEAYKSAKAHIEKEISRFVKNQKELPSMGVFGSSIVLERLVTSFLSAHLLYRLGNAYEGHAVARLILEQIAWAYLAHSQKDLLEIKKIVTTKAISELKKIVPESGSLYGFLSKKTHIDYSSHPEFITIEQGRNIILLSHTDYYEYAKVILTLADLFGIVWEISQFNYMSKKESVEKKGDTFIVRQNRPFLKIMRKHLNKLEKMRRMD